MSSSNREIHDYQISLAAAVASPFKKNPKALTLKKPQLFKNAHILSYDKFVQIRTEELRDAA